MNVADQIFINGRSSGVLFACPLQNRRECCLSAYVGLSIRYCVLFRMTVVYAMVELLAVFTRWLAHTSGVISLKSSWNSSFGRHSAVSVDNHWASYGCAFSLSAFGATNFVAAFSWHFWEA